MKQLALDSFVESMNLDSLQYVTVSRNAPYHIAVNGNSQFKLLPSIETRMLVLNSVSIVYQIDHTFCCAFDERPYLSTEADQQN